MRSIIQLMKLLPFRWLGLLTVFLLFFSEHAYADWTVLPPSTMVVNTGMPAAEASGGLPGTPNPAPWYIKFWWRSPSGVWGGAVIGATGGSVWSGTIPANVFTPNEVGTWYVSVSAHTGSNPSAPVGNTIASSRSIVVTAPAPPDVTPTAIWNYTPGAGTVTANASFNLSVRGDSNGDNDIACIRIWRAGEDETTGQWLLTDYTQNYGWINHWRVFNLPGGQYTFYGKTLDKGGKESPVITFNLTIAGAPAPPTGFRRSGVDLSDMLSAKLGGSTAARVTGIRSGGVDLNQIYNRIEDSRSDVYRDLSNVPVSNPSGLVNYNGQPISMPNAILPDGSNGQVIEFGGNPYHVMFELNICAPGFLKKNTTYCYGFWARTTSGYRHIAIATSYGADGSGLVYTDESGAGSQFIDTNWRWIQVERSFGNDDFTWARFHMVVSGSDVPFQIYKPTIVQNRLTKVRSVAGLSVSSDLNRWQDVAFVFAPLNGL